MTYPLKATVVFHGKSGLPEDVFINTFWWQGAGDAPPSEMEQSLISQCLTDFYMHNNDVSAGPIRDYLANIVQDAPDPQILFYGPLGGSPIGEGSILGFNAFGSPPPKSLPAEVAFCLSFHGDMVGVSEDIPQPPAGPKGDLHMRARRRGRIFLGPLTVNAMATFGDGTTQDNDDARPSSKLISAVTKAAVRLQSKAAVAPDLASWSWAVHSKKDAQTYPIIGGWVDNAFDTQRRRGLDPTVRTLWPV